MGPKRGTDVDAGAEGDSSRPSLEDKTLMTTLLLLARDGRPLPVVPQLPSSDGGADEPEVSPDSKSQRMRSQSLSVMSTASYQMDTSVDPTLQLVSFIARAMGCEDYWTKLKSQILVDEHVEFIQFCADSNFTCAKTLHVQQWLTHMRWLILEAEDLVASGEAVKMIAKEEASGINQLERSEKPGEEKTSKKSKQQKRSASSPKKNALEPAASPTSDSSSPSPSTVSPKPKSERIRILEELVQGDQSFFEVLSFEIAAFVEREITEGHKWERMCAQLREPSEASLLQANAKGKKGSSKNDKAKQQQLQQLELEEELMRQAAAALPPENIYLTKEEIDSFLKKFLFEGLLQHESLFKFVQTEAQCGGKTNSTSISVSVEKLFSISLLQDGKEVVNSAAEKENEDSEAKLSATTKKGAGAKGGKKAAVEEEEKPKEVEVIPTAMEDFRAQQEKELAILRRKHNEAEEVHAFHEKTAQTERDMQFIFDRQGTQKAVEDVFESMEGSLTDREFRILQRVEALEVTLGIRPNPLEQNK